MLKIKSIKFKDHFIFGNKKFDFSLYNGEPAENIIIIGENGAGKTNFIKEITNFVYIENLYNNNQIAVNNIINKLKNIDILEIELKFEMADVFIPSLFFETSNLNFLIRYNDFYIIPNWKKKISQITVSYPQMSKQNIVDSLIEYTNQSGYMAFFNFSNFVNKLKNTNHNYYSINSRPKNENYIKWKSFFLKKNHDLIINLSINDFNSNVIKTIDVDENYIFHTNNYSIIDEISFKFENIINFNSLIFWNDNFETIWEKIVNIEKKYVENAKNNTSNLDLKTINIFGDIVINLLNENKIIEKQILYENNEITKITNEWIKSKINFILNDVNLSHIDKNLYDFFINELNPLVNSIKKFFENEKNKIEIYNINWNDQKFNEIKFVKNKNKLNFNKLSSGEKLTLSICMSILNRIVHITNENKDNEYLNLELSEIVNNNLEKSLQSHNIVLFDEIESSLHPEWQSKILDLIKNTIPNVGQKILTTHSPIVCYSINPKTDIIINLSDENDLISFNNYTSIQDCVNKSLNFDYRILSDEHDLWVEGMSDKLYFDIAKKQNKELMPFNILANKHSKNECGFSHLSGSDFIIKNILINFLFNEDEKNRKRNLIAILDGDVLNKSHNMNFVLDFFSKEEDKTKIKDNINNWDELETILENAQNNKDDLNTILLNIKNKNNNLFQLFILKEDSIEFYLEHKNDNKEFKSLLNDFKHKQCDISDKECKESKKNIKINIEQIIQNDNSKLETTNIDKIFAEIKNSLNKN